MVVSSLSSASWRKSSYSAGSGQCVEAAPTVDIVGVRDTKNRSAGVIAVRSRTWRSFVASLPWM